ncbi:MAG: NF038129 family PEP-CTERM protein, partial [Candidatus Saccharimonadales bacterium]
MSGAHTYAEEGDYSVIVSVRDADGSVASISQTTFGESAGGPVTYRVSIDTTALAGTSGFLDFQLNPGALPDAQSAGATIENFRTVGGSVGGVSTTGSVSGDLSGAAVLGNAAMLNELKQGFTFGTSVSFDVRLDGDALTLPGRGLFGSTFALRFLAADGGTPVDTTAADGAALRISVYPDGGTQLSANAPHVTAAAVNTVTVADAPLTTSLVPIDAIEGTPFAGTVASFTDANPAATPTDFTANILWGDGSAATAGTIVADGGTQFHVTGGHTYVEAGAFAIRVVVRDSGGSVGSATDAMAGKTQISGLQAPRVAFAGLGNSGQPVSFASGDFNGDGKPDMAIWHNAPAGPLLMTLDMLLGNGDGSFQAPITVISNTTPNSSLMPIAIADFNGDGHLDIASNDTLLLGNGDGTFQPGKVYDGGAPNVGLAVADFNGDGLPDLAVANGFGLNGPNPGVRILLGNGDGTFGSETTYLDASASTGISLVAGDFNGDGKP